MPFTLKLPRSLDPGRAQAFMDEVVQPFLERSATYLKEELEQISPEGVTGALRGRYFTRVEPDAASAVGFRGDVLTSVKYAKYVDQGTAPHWVSIGHLQEWADLKDINVYALQHTIAQKGTEGQFFFQRAKTNTLPQIRLDWQRTVGALVHKYSNR